MMLHKLRAGDKAPYPKAKAMAVVNIRDAGEMTPAERKRIAKWLRAQADMLIAEGHNYSDTFRGRYLAP